MTLVSATQTSKRNFYLMLSPPDGQEIAVATGFHASSDEVYEEEQKDVLRSWAILTQTGIVDSLSEAADWMSDLMVSDSSLPDPKDLDENQMVQMSFDFSDEDSDNYFQVEPVSYEALVRMHQQIKDSTYNTVLGCIVSSVSKLLDEELINLTGLEIPPNE